MTDAPTAAQIAAFLEDEGNVEALTDAVQELQRIFRDGTADRPPRGILPIENIQAMPQEDHRQIHSLYNPNPFCYSRPDILDAYTCAMRAGCHFGIDLANGRDFTSTKD